MMELVSTVGALAVEVRASGQCTTQHPLGPAYSCLSMRLRAYRTGRALCRGGADADKHLPVLPTLS